MLIVLVADDEFAVLEVISMALEGEGHRVLKAGDGADALRILVSQPCDVVVSDDKMPVMNGLQLLVAMRAEPRLSQIPFILMSESWGKPPPAVEGAIVLAKPVRLTELFEQVELAGKSGPRRRP